MLHQVYQDGLRITLSFYLELPRTFLLLVLFFLMTSSNHFSSIFFNTSIISRKTWHGQQKSINQSQQRQPENSTPIDRTCSTCSYYQQLDIIIRFDSFSRYTVQEKNPILIWKTEWNSQFRVYCISKSLH